jgi:endonuclease/exonuclease/phosphatase family metal-dependent hydrolase
VPFGSGLNTLANFDWIDFRRIQWNRCSDASSSDCLTPKGFTFMRMQVDAEVFIDVYNLHADAGTEDDDLAARRENIQQVADYINVWSIGNPVLVFGDTNTRYSRTGDNPRLFGTQNGLIDPWVELIRGGVTPTAESLCGNPSTTTYCETVDKVFYRGSPLLNLQATYWNYESSRFLQADGNILSDHNPITVNFTWSQGASLRQSYLFGGPHGNWFSDVPTLAGKSRPKTSSITFRGASRLDSVALTLSDGTALTHGGTGGTATSLTLGSSEFWTRAELCRGQRNGQTRNFYIKATTSSGRTLASGTTTSDCQTFVAPSGWQIVGFIGQDGDEMDQIAFVYAPQ